MTGYLLLNMARIQQPYIHQKYRTQEESDIKAFLKFARQFVKNYVQTASTVYGSSVDVVSANLTGGTVLTELKERSAKRLGDPDIMIEPHKLDCLERYWKEKGMWTFYLNFYKGTELAYLFFIPGIIHLKDTFRFQKDMSITWDGINTKIEDRYFIPAEYGYKIDLLNGEILSKPKEKAVVSAPRAYDIPFGEGEITMEQIDNADER